jgi:hypothetical protein
LCLVDLVIESRWVSTPLAFAGHGDSITQPSSARQNVWFASFLFMGLMIPEDDVPLVFRPLCTIMPFKYVFRTVLWTEWHDTEYDGARAVTGAADIYGRGFVCDDPNLALLGCYGRTGLQVLNSFKAVSCLLSTPLAGSTRRSGTTVSGGVERRANLGLNNPAV